MARLSRKTLAIIAGVAAVVLAALLFYALRSPAPVSGGHEVYATGDRATPEAISRLPRDYGDVPKLGPPLPGDLGKPMLAAGVTPQPGDTVPGARAPDPEAQRVADARQRRAQAIEAARASQLFAVDAGAAAPATPVSPIESGVEVAGSPDNTAVPSSAGEQGRTERQLAFLNRADARSTSSAERLQSPASPYVLQAGSIIPAALVTGLSSELPGQVIAQVTRPVFDSVAGKHLLIPQGSRLLGEYDADVGTGQSRALLVWTRLILPDGRSLTLGREPAADVAGAAGLKDRVDRHWGALFRAAAISTLLGVGTELVAGDAEDRLVRALRRGTQDAIGDAGEQLVGRSLTIAPTLTVRPGTPVRVILTRDLVVEPWKG